MLTLETVKVNYEVWFLAKVHLQQLLPWLSFLDEPSIGGINLVHLQSIRVSAEGKLQKLPGSR